MTLEVAVQNLADAINAHAEAVRFAASIQGTSAAVTALAAASAKAESAEAASAKAESAEAAEKRGRGRPPGAKNKAKDEPEPPVAPSEGALPTAEPAPAAPAAPAGLSKSDVQKVLIEVVQKIGRDACGDLCKAHGGPNLSALPASVYPALYADAKALLAANEV